MIKPEKQLDQPSSVSNAPVLLKLGLLEAALFAQERGVELPQLADRMNVLLPNITSPITTRRLSAWLGLGNEDRPFPAAYICAYCVSTENYEPLNNMATAINKVFLTAKQMEFVEVQDILLKISELQNVLAQKSGALEEKYGWKVCR